MKIPGSKKSFASALATLAFAGQFMAPPKASAYSLQNDIDLQKAYQSAPGHNDMAGRVYHLAIEDMKKGHMRSAHKYLVEVNRLDPRCAAAYASDAYCLAQLGFNKEGVDQLTHAISFDNSKPVYFYRKGLYLMSGLDFKIAIDNFNRVLEKSPDDKDALRQIVRCYRGTGQLLQAQQILTTMIDRKLYTAEALCERAQINNQLGNPAAALKDSNAAIALDPQNAEPFIVRGNALFALKQYRDAHDNFTAALVRGTEKFQYVYAQRKLAGMQAAGTGGEKH